MSNTTSPRTFVLYHGGFHGGWCWKPVAERLRALGHTVYTPTLTGLGDRAHLLTPETGMETAAQDLRSLFFYEDIRDAIVVGHSFGGSMVSLAADQAADRVAHLVYLDAMILTSGQSPADVCPPGHIDRYAQIAQDLGHGKVIPTSSPAHFGITEPEMAQWVSDRMTPQPLKLFQDALVLDNPLGNGKPATYIACSDPYWKSTANARELAKSMPGWTYLELATAHNAMLLKPDTLTDMLTQIAETLDA